MKIYVDADACPVIPIIIKLAEQYHTQCILLCDTSHEFHYPGVKTRIVDKGPDSTDYALVNLLSPDDLVITQDYGLASMSLAKKARVMHQDGWEYTPQNIDVLLLQRHVAKKTSKLRPPYQRTPKKDKRAECHFRRPSSENTPGIHIRRLHLKFHSVSSDRMLKLKSI